MRVCKRSPKMQNRAFLLSNGLPMIFLKTVGSASPSQQGVNRELGSLIRNCRDAELQKLVDNKVVDQ